MNPKIEKINQEIQKQQARTFNKHCDYGSEHIDGKESCRVRHKHYHAEHKA